MAKILNSKDGAKLLDLAAKGATNLIRPVVAQQTALKRIVQLLLADAPPELLQELLHTLDRETAALAGGSDEALAAWEEVCAEWKGTVERIKNASK